MLRTPKSKKPLSVESLEPRWAMAGDVAAFLGLDQGGQETILTVEGDNAANEICITEIAPGHARIEGLNGTTVNGKAADEVFLLAGERFSLAEIDLGNGDDAVTYDFASDERRNTPTNIDTGNGDDSVTVLAANCVGPSVNTGNGADQVTIFTQGIVSYFRVDTGQGGDRVTIDMAPTTMFIDGYGGGFDINTGGDSDDVLIRANSEGGELPEFFYWSQANISTGNGDDVVKFEGTFYAHYPGVVYVNLGGGDDTLIGDSDSTLVDPFVQAYGGTGNDTVLNASYFSYFYYYFLRDFETIED